MPIGTITKTTERHDLTTLPEGFVVIRRMTYGEKLQRQDDMLSMKTSMGDNIMEVNMFNKRAALADFGNLIVDHNITDENDRKLNFKDAKDVVALDPRIGDEIGAFIDKINSYENTDAVKN